MAGLKSRRKGMRIEYEVRDALREVGFVVDRVPASGASQGFKGDLRIRYNSQDILVEVKSRKDGFANLYKLFKDELTSILIDNDVIISKDPGCAVLGIVKEKYGEYFTKTNPKLFQMLKSLFILRGNSDILCVKKDRSECVYIRWLAEHRYSGKFSGSC